MTDSSLGVRSTMRCPASKGFETRYQAVCHSNLWHTYDEMPRFEGV